MKRLRSVGCVAVGIGMLVTFTGCGGGGGGEGVAGGGGVAPALDAPVVGVWEATSAQVDGQATDIAEAMGLDPSVDKVISVFWNDRTRTVYAFAGETPVANQRATWAASGNTVAISTLSHTVTYQCTVRLGQLTMTHRRGGATVVVRWEQVANDAGAGRNGAECGSVIGQALMGTWQAVGATIGGQPVPIPQGIGCDVSADRIIIVVHGYGTMARYVYAGANTLETAHAMWTETDSVVSIYWTDHTETFDCTVADGQLTLTCGSGSDAVVLAWEKVH